jgi:hypothetical protein
MKTPLSGYLGRGFYVKAFYSIKTNWYDDDSHVYKIEKLIMRKPFIDKV